MASFSPGLSMIGLIQRVTRASVTVQGATVAAIGPGLLVLVGVERDDGPAEVARLAERLVGFRVFPDEQGRMNRSVLEARGELLLVPQFTLVAETRRGNRPGFDRAAPPEVARQRFDQLVAAVRQHQPGLQTGVFGADMAVSLVNDGPVTFWLQASAQAPSQA